MPPRQHVSVTDEAQKATAATRSLTVIFTIIGSIASSVTIVMVNKHVLNNGFPYATSLTALHQLFGWIFATAFEWAEGPRPPPTEHRPPLRWIDRWLVGTSYAAGLVLMNQSLKMNPVTIYQLLKMACVPTIVVIQLFYGITISLLTTLSLFLILVGVGLCTLGDPHLSQSGGREGLLIGVLGVLATSASQVWLQALPALKGLNGIRTICVTAPYAFAVCVAAAAVYDWDVGVLVSQDMTEWRRLPELVWTGLDNFTKTAPVGSVLGSCFLSILTNYYGFAVIQSTSAVTYQVVGHSKTILTIAVGSLLFGDAAQHLTPRKLAGMTITFIGVIVYSASKSKAAPKPAPSKQKTQ
ncbi:hypothetical protein HDU96_005464 [Phlyctochytrium bullatum]|nr:hypothetical protein HDU96_005464 [Phlyctochytrium bullatum]